MFHEGFAYEELQPVDLEEYSSPYPELNAI